MRVLFFGTYDADSHPRVAVLRDGLAAALSNTADPVTVDECNVPLGLSTAARVSMLRRPWLLPRLVLRLAICWATLIRRARRRPRPDVVVVGYLGHFDVLLARRLFRGVPIVLDHLVGASDTASDRGVSGGLRQRLLRGLDARALAAADIVVVDTDEHRATLPAAHRATAVVVSVGAPTAWFNAAYDDAAHTACTASRDGCPDHGAGRWAERGDRCAGCSAGRVLRPLHPAAGHPDDRCSSGGDRGRPGRRDDDRLGTGPGRDPAARVGQPPGAMARLGRRRRAARGRGRHDVCLGIFGTGPKARRVVPNKVFQGAAAGAAIVTSDTPPQRRLLGDAAVFVAPGDSAAWPPRCATWRPTGTGWFACPGGRAPAGAGRVRTGAGRRPLW